LVFSSSGEGNGGGGFCSMFGVKKSRENELSQRFV